jgi:hypothetical protein
MEDYQRATTPEAKAEALRLIKEEYAAQKQRHRDDPVLRTADPAAMEAMSARLTDQLDQQLRDAGAIDPPTNVESWPRSRC